MCVLPEGVAWVQNLMGWGRFIVGHLLLLTLRCVASLRLQSVLVAICTHFAGFVATMVCGSGGQSESQNNDAGVLLRSGMRPGEA